MKGIVPPLILTRAEPINLRETLESQAIALIEAQVPQQVGLGREKFLDEAMAKADAFVYSYDLADIGLDQVWMVHYGVQDRYLAEVCGIDIWTNPDKFTLYNGVSIPTDGIWICQGSMCSKYNLVSPWDVRYHHSPLEELGIAKEGLTAFIYYGRNQLLNRQMHFPGNYTEYRTLPDLCFRYDRFVMSAIDGNSPGNGSGSLCRGKYEGKNIIAGRL